MEQVQNPWRALWALILGFFMILIDTTIVTVANPSIQASLEVDTNAVIWVTSAYLLTYAVPLLITGRLGDRFGPRRIYLIGLAVFTASSLLCGLADALPGSAIGNLIAARAFQGLGASLMTPQTMAIITRTFPAARRGSAMALWGATAGIAGLLGPLAGGVLVDGPGWEWIFIVNVPIGAVAFVAAWFLVPTLETHSHSFDWVGVALSGLGMFGLVFGLQEGQAKDWAPWVWLCIVAGVACLGVFVWWQGRTRKEPLLPLSLFHDRNFSIANGAVMAVGFTVTSMMIPVMYFFQIVMGMSPTQSALMTAPSAVMSLLLARLSGRLVDRVHPRVLAVPGTVLMSAGLWAYAGLMRPDASIVALLGASLLIGVGSAFTWGPLATTANRTLPPQSSGAGSGVYNATRQVGSVIGSAAVATLIVGRLSAHLDGGSAGFSTEVSGSFTLPEELAAPFSTAMSETIMLPAAAILIASVLTAFFVTPHHLRVPADDAAASSA
ncbi:DHA2 family efflux MFS transporter permease subunit [Demequina salsinemoris]|uniref:DHA2 family efflux MFS transporter permease subunit n=1 Tax=Demequina salsinemoris TaxID=577470 RepID=UPI0007839954|nr:DHA2 family efflux MFS transporter permease subunit [Demequina salsinemoris]